MTALISEHPVQKINCNPLSSLQSWISFSKYLFCFVFRNFSIKFIYVFGGIWQYNVEIRKQKFLWSVANRLQRNTDLLECVSGACRRWGRGSGKREKSGRKCKTSSALPFFFRFPHPSQIVSIHKQSIGTKKQQAPRRVSHSSKISGNYGTKSMEHKFSENSFENFGRPLDKNGAFFTSKLYASSFHTVKNYFLGIFQCQR